MKRHIATFVSHYDALRFSKECGVACRLRPVPRAVSSSCGTCASFLAEECGDVPLDRVEAVYGEHGEGWVLEWKRER